MKKIMDHVEYPKKLKKLSEAALQYIRMDAEEALRAMPEGINAGYYADEINYISDELRKRQKNT